MPDLPSTSDGPERFHGGPKCPDHHDGVRSGYGDDCCCCHPCLYERPPLGTEMGFACRCAPQVLCFVFTPDNPDDCCRTIVNPVVPTYYTSPSYVTYGGEFSSIDLEWKLDSTGWTLTSSNLGLNDNYPIDHVTETCLSIPAIEIAGVTIGGCDGTISFSNYEAAKLPFIRRDLTDTPDITIADPPCNCTAAAPILCVNGRRHIDGEIEFVEFTWDTESQDRWHYLPPCGDPSTDRELIFLRSDADGNCYLELDFEQSGPWTNDWADPPNTFDEYDPHEVREGLILAPTCGCNLRVTSETTEGRFVTIHAGPCGRWEHVCGDCRCAPQKVCVIGNIDGEFFDTEGDFEVVDGTYGWTVPAVGTVPEFRIVLANADCIVQERGLSDECALTATGDFATPFGKSAAIDCGKFLSAEIFSEIDPYDVGPFNWLWVSSAVCGCSVATCGPCLAERCGGPPKELVVELRARCYAPIPYIDEGCPDCDLDVTVGYWQRWDTTGPPLIICGYIGYSDIIWCLDRDPDYWFQIRVELTNSGATMYLSKRDSDHPGTDDDPYPWFAVDPGAVGGVAVAPTSCDPYSFDTGWVADPDTACSWGCFGKDEYKISVREP